MSDDKRNWESVIRSREEKWNGMLAELTEAGINRIDLWGDDQPKYANANGFRAGLYLYPVHKSGCGTVIICAGGAFLFKSPNEAKPVAEYFLQAGLNAAILDYSVDKQGPLPGTQIPPVRKAAGEDALRAVRYLRANASELGIRGDKIAIAGFSAGGRTAQIAASAYDDGDAGAVNQLDRVSSRPDAVLLLYGAPAYTTSVAGYHGYNADEQKRVAETDMIRNLKLDCPPIFIFQTNEDDPRHALCLAWELAARGLPHEVHTFCRGPHGGGLYNGCDGDTPRFPHTAKWAELAVSWLKEQNFD